MEANRTHQIAQARVLELEESVRVSDEARKHLDDALRFAEDERQRLERALTESDNERRRLSTIAAEVPVEARRCEDALREVTRLRSQLDHLEAQNADLRRTTRDAQQQAHKVSSDAEAAARIAHAAVEDKERLRCTEQETARQKIDTLRLEFEGRMQKLEEDLESERSRRREATQAVISAEAQQQAVLAEQARQRLQLENSARLERNARRDLQDERDLIRTLLKADDDDCASDDVAARFAPGSTVEHGSEKTLTETTTCMPRKDTRAEGTTLPSSGCAMHAEGSTSTLRLGSRATHDSPDAITSSHEQSEGHLERGSLASSAFVCSGVASTMPHMASIPHGVGSHLGSPLRTGSKSHFDAGRNNASSQLSTTDLFSVC